MPDLQILFRRSARKDLQRLDGVHVRRIFPAIEQLGATPRPPGCKKLKGSEDLFRIRVGDYRVIYEIRQDVVVIVGVRHRSEAYR